MGACELQAAAPAGHLVGYDTSSSVFLFHFILIIIVIFLLLALLLNNR